MVKNKYNIIVTILAILFLLFGLYQMNEKNNANLQRNNVNNFLSDTISYYNNKLGQEVATKQSLAGDKNQLEVLLSKQIDSTQQLKGLLKKYKKIAAAGNIRTVTKIDSVFIPFDSPIQFDFSRKFKVDNLWYSITGKTHKLGLDINNLIISNEMSFVLGIRKNGIFKPKTYSIDVISSNPFIQTTGADSYQFAENIKRWSIGPSIGYNPFTNKVEATISLQYGIIRF